MEADQRRPSRPDDPSSLARTGRGRHAGRASAGARDFDDAAYSAVRSPRPWHRRRSLRRRFWRAGIQDGQRARLENTRHRAWIRPPTRRRRRRHRGFRTDARWAPWGRPTIGTPLFLDVAGRPRRATGDGAALERPEAHVDDGGGAWRLERGNDGNAVERRLDPSDRPVETTIGETGRAAVWGRPRRPWAVRADDLGSPLDPAHARWRSGRKHRSDVAPRVGWALRPDRSWAVYWVPR